MKIDKRLTAFIDKSDVFMICLPLYRVDNQSSSINMLPEHGITIFIIKHLLR
ncbi:MAG: hypothetical protein ACXWT0_00950 [Methylobacter sp.]